MRALILSCSTDLVGCGIQAGKRLFGEKAWEKRGNLILNGIDVAGFVYDAEKRAAIRAKLGLGDRFVLGHAGHLAEVKNQSFLLDLMPEVLKRRPDAMLLLLGEGGDRPMLEQKIRDMALQNHVIMTGNVTNVADYLSAMDVFVFPSIYEGVPVSMVEAQTAGLPCCISTNVPRETAITGLVEFISLEQNPEFWAERIRQRAEDPRRDMTREIEQAGFDVSATSKWLENFYRKVVAERGRAH